MATRNAQQVKKFWKNIQPHEMVCNYCGTTVSRTLPEADPCRATVDHFVPLSKGGGNRMENLRVCCFACNRDRGNHQDLVPHIPRVKERRWYSRSLSIEDCMRITMDKTRKLLARQALRRRRTPEEIEREDGMAEAEGFEPSVLIEGTHI